MNGCFLKFYVAEKRRHHHHLAYEWLLEEAKRFGLHGGSAFRALAGFDGSDSANTAFDFALDLAHKYGAELHVVAVARQVMAYAPCAVTVVRPGASQQN